MDRKDVPSARRRVFCLGILSMVVALGQMVLYLIVTKIVLSAEHRDIQVATAAGLMSCLTAVYLALTGRILFLLYERRFSELAGPEWVWWFASLGLVLFNLLLLVWFSLLSDVMMAAACVLAIIIYVLFFIFAKDDIKYLHDQSQQ